MVRWMIEAEKGGRGVLVGYGAWWHFWLVLDK